MVAFFQKDQCQWIPSIFATKLQEMRTPINLTPMMKKTPDNDHDISLHVRCEVIFFDLPRLILHIKNIGTTIDLSKSVADKDLHT